MGSDGLPVAHVVAGSDTHLSTDDHVLSHENLSTNDDSLSFAVGQPSRARAHAISIGSCCLDLRTHQDMVPDGDTLADANGHAHRG